MIRLRDIYKSYRMGEMTVPVLNGIDLQIEPGEFVAIMGPSGSGKTTLLNVIGCLDSIDSGEFLFNQEVVNTADDQQMASLRSQHIGFVFQLFNLIPRISALRNVELPMLYANVPRAERKQRALAVLQRVGLSDRAQHVPTQLSGGQQQRVAIARALVNRPALIVADEPTGSLDSRTSREIMQLFGELNHEGVTIVMVTHENEIAAHAHRIVNLYDGCIGGPH